MARKERESQVSLLPLQLTGPSVSFQMVYIFNIAILQIQGAPFFSSERNRSCYMSPSPQQHARTALGSPTSFPLSLLIVKHLCQTDKL